AGCTWRRGGGVAVRSARAAAGQAADYRVPRRRRANKPTRMGRRICAAVARTRLDRWSHRRDRVPLGRGTPRALCRLRAEFVGRKVDLIFANGTEPALAAKRATSIIPIIFPVAGDPIGSGLVSSLARPGGNVTGLSNLATDLAAKRLEILR